jgi:alpha-L-fucosidase 2
MLPAGLLVALAVSAAVQEIHDLEFARPDGVPLTLDAEIPAARAGQPAVILVHGGGWEAGDKRTYIKPWFPALSEARIAWFTINYRLAPRYPYPAAVEDVESAVRFLQANAKKFGIDPERLALMGESAGGHLVSLVGARGKVRVKTVISFYGVHDIVLVDRQRGQRSKNLSQFLGAIDAADASPITYVQKGMPPYLFIHGTSDKTVPFEQSTVMCDRMKAAGARCEVFPVAGAPHGVEGWEKDPAWLGYKKKMVAWLQAELGR